MSASKPLRLLPGPTHYWASVLSLAVIGCSVVQTTSHGSVWRLVRLNPARPRLTIYPPYPGDPTMPEWSYQNGGDWAWFGGRVVSRMVCCHVRSTTYMYIRSHQWLLVCWLIALLVRQGFMNGGGKTAHRKDQITFMVLLVCWVRQ